MLQTLKWRNFEQTDISDEAVNYYQNYFNKIKNFETKKKTKWILTSTLKMYQNLNKKAKENLYWTLKSGKY